MLRQEGPTCSLIGGLPFDLDTLETSASIAHRRPRSELQWEQSKYGIHKHSSDSLQALLRA